ncbi:related to PCL6 - cyclin like protein interacting with Pho85p [Ustilago trichophora]|uniref:Related to PCL6 - cyclin like protein interacting with Pho85p n=1 Tax=Ustilago trichophora TaxID=86804 RepID=A0A5C3E4N3_9BASI|nr:related to PCL6 - cyclin like protein interacting with Pho85p [Ustilago trichophora]
MLSTSPDHSSAASPPGPPSSQSSSVGSCYTSSSSQASLRARPTLSHPSSSATSPASTYDRVPEHTYGSVHTKRPAQSAASYLSQSSSASHTPVDYRFNDPFANSCLGSHSSPRDHYTRSGAMEHSSSTTYEALDPRGFHRAGPSNGIASDYSTQGAKQGQSLGSPDNHRGGPAPKARRTSPGGSRASGNLDASQGSTAYNYGASPHSVSHVSRSPDHTGALSSGMHTSSTSAAVAHRSASHMAPAETDSYNHWQQLQQHSTQAAQASTSAMPSPRTRVNDSQVDSAGLLSTSDALAPHSTSSKVSSSSLTDRSGIVNKSKPPPLPKMDLATFPPQELLKILATLLHEIATANDEFQPDGSKDDPSRSRRGARSRDRSAPATSADSGDAAETVRDYSAPPGSHLSFSDPRRPSVTLAALGALATPSSTLCFHARNVPSISIESYLLRILKYCPTTNEVFLSLLVYFDRMSRMGTGAKPGANGEGEVAGEAAGLPRAVERATGQSDVVSDASTRPSDSTKEAVVAASQPYTHPGIRGFAIDSYNVHRLVIAGVTVASKFFSDVFYTNSRYAKVGGLPPHELNQLELQFLLLNDFRLTIPLEEMQRYADQLLMYASGRPDMVKMTKEVSGGIVVPRGEGSRVGSSASASASGEIESSKDAAAAAAASNAAINKTGIQAGAGVNTEVGPTTHQANAVDPEADAEGDVPMSEAQR